MKLLKWRYGLLLSPVALWLLSGNAQAVTNVTCEAGMNTAAGSTGIVNISNAVTPANADNANISATLNYSCTNSGTAGYVSVCLAIDGGSSDATIVDPRYMKNDNASLAFTMTLSGGVLWSTRGKTTGSEYNSGLLAISENSSVSGSVPINISLLSGYNNATEATEGLYINDFNGGHTALTFRTSDNTTPAPDCSTGNLGEDRFPFTVQATVIPSCLVISTSDVSLGSHSANEKNITGNNPNAIGVTCTNGAPYTVGLMPSNNNVNGAGVMSGTGSNTDKVPYQLRSAAGSAGTIWGNTATSTTVGNGIAGTGTGIDHSQTVYVTVPSADFRPDNYSDTVTISVNY